MSLGHITLKRVSGTSGKVVEYEVRSPDLSRIPGEEAAIGVLRIDVQSSTYSFIPTGELAGTLVVPPNVFEFDELEIEKKLNGEFKGYGLIPWSRRLSRVARLLIQKGVFPDEYP